MGGIYFPSWLPSRAGGQLPYIHMAKPGHSHYRDGGAELRDGTLDSGEVQMTPNSKGEGGDSDHAPVQDGVYQLTLPCIYV